ncbi:MAG TPA: flagellin [Opitutaceae bacterium]
MSVVINTNYAATLAANNLASSNALLQRSLNRLSSGSKIVNPNDDAGGLAVSMKLAATSRRQQAINANLGNSVSYLQTQDGALKTAGKVLDRISELKTLYSDPTKNTEDLANYDAEFTQLKDQLSSLAGEEFNGIALFGSSTMSVPSTGDANASTLEFGGANLLGTGNATSFTDEFDSLSNWTTGSSGDARVDNTVDDLDLLTAAGGSAWATSNQIVSGPFNLELSILSASSDDELRLQLGGVDLATFTFGGGAGQIPLGASTLTLSFDGAGNVSASADGNAIGTQSTSATSGALTIRNDYSGSSVTEQLIYFDRVSVNVTGAGTISDSNVATVANASSLASLSLDSVTSALQEVATLRAENGAQQSRLGFAAEVNAVNKANIEAAHSRIMDVDVAQESTALAKYNILVQAGTSMLSQANQSAQTALKLIG